VEYKITFTVFKNYVNNMKLGTRASIVYCYASILFNCVFKTLENENYTHRKRSREIN